MNKDAVKELERYALEHYEAGGHWVYECWVDEDYDSLLKAKGMDLKAAREYLQYYWELTNEQQAETRWE